jgi:hypothetical protein
VKAVDLTSKEKMYAEGVKIYNKKNLLSMKFKKGKRNYC